MSAIGSVSPWTPAAAGSYALTAKATDNQGAATTSAAATITVQAARFLKKHRIPTLYRVHGQPEADRHQDHDRAEGHSRYSRANAHGVVR